MNSKILNNHSSLNHFKVFSGKNNNSIVKSEKYNLTRKELCVLLIKNMTKDDIDNIVKYLNLNSDDYLFVIKQCFILINKSRIVGSLDYKDLFMERILLNNCFSAIVLLKTLHDRLYEEKEEITDNEFLAIKNIISIKNIIEPTDNQFISRLWYNRRFRKITKLQKEKLQIISDKYKIQIKQTIKKQTK